MLGATYGTTKTLPFFSRLISNLRVRLLDIDYFLSEKVINLRQSRGSLASRFFISDAKSREALD